MEVGLDAQTGIRRVPDAATERAPRRRLGVADPDSHPLSPAEHMELRGADLHGILGRIRIRAHRARRSAQRQPDHRVAGAAHRTELRVRLRKRGFPWLEPQQRGHRQPAVRSAQLVVGLLAELRDFIGEVAVVHFPHTVASPRETIAAIHVGAKGEVQPFDVG